MHILLPGPTPVPQPVERAMLTAMTDHRGSLFEKVRESVLRQLATIFGVEGPGYVAVLPSSGTGGLEAAVQNLFSPGDRVLMVETGAFGQRFAKVAESQGLAVDHLEVTWGSAFSPKEIMSQIQQTSYRGILVTHNETSTGVLNPVKELARQLKGNGPLLVVDSISGMPSIPLQVSDGPDVIITASQKGFMCPPGLAMLAFSPRGRESILSARPGRSYFDLQPYLQGNFPYTPAISLWHGLNAALDILQEEGAETRLSRHTLLRDVVRAFAQSGGLSLLVDEPAASPTVTALGLPPSLKPAQLRLRLEAKGLQISGAMGPWRDFAIRIGHVGAVDLGDLWAGLGLLAPELPKPQAALAAALNAVLTHTPKGAALA